METYSHDKLGLKEFGGIRRKKSLQNVQDKSVVILTCDCSISKLKDEDTIGSGSGSNMV